MLGDLKPYPAYKDSGVEWLGKVPEHWGVKRVRSCVRNVIQQTDSATESDAYVALEHVESWTGRVRPCVTGSVFDSQVKRFSVGDVLFGKLRPYLAKVTRPKLAGVCVGEFLVLRPCVPDLDAAFLEIELRSKPIVDTISSSTFGAKMPRAEWQFIGNMGLPVPPLLEQSAIVRFLDHVDRRIRRYIRAKQKLIKLLEEQKQAIVQRAVTRGLDPNVPMKESGLPWLGEIPAHWTVTRIKYVLREVDLRSTTGHETLLSMRMYQGIVPFAEHFTRPPQAATVVGFKVVRPGQFVINRMQAGNGLIFPSILHGLVSPDYAVFDAICDVNVTFLGELFRCPKLRVKFTAESKGLGTGTSGFLRLYSDRLGAIHIALPPRAEQDAILHGMMRQLQELDVALDRANQEISLFREYRTRLIADVVTGKLDVREAAARLPAEPEEPEPLDEPEDISNADEDARDDGEAVPEEAEN